MSRTGTTGERGATAGDGVPTKSTTGGSGGVPHRDRAALIVAALRAPSFQQDSQWHHDKAVYATKPRDLLAEAADKIEGLEADLREAVRTAYYRGAMTWARLNYPAWAAHFDAEMRVVLADEGTREA